MARLQFNLKQTAGKRTLQFEVDADRLERLAALFGLFNPDFLRSLARAERDYKAGRVRHISSFKELA